MTGKGLQTNRHLTGLLGYLAPRSSRIRAAGWVLMSRSCVAILGVSRSWDGFDHVYFTLGRCQKAEPHVVHLNIRVMSKTVGMAW